MIEQDPALQKFADFVHVKVIEECLLIDLIENYERPMFTLGSSILSQRQTSF